MEVVVILTHMDGQACNRQNGGELQGTGIEVLGHWDQRLGPEIGYRYVCR